jgi:hypothetical protein
MVLTIPIQLAFPGLALALAIAPAPGKLQLPLKFKSKNWAHGPLSQSLTLP